MEEFENKLSRKDPVLVLSVVKTLTKRIRTFKEKGNDNEREKYVRYLREKCFSRDLCVCTTSIDGLLSLYEGQRPVFDDFGALMADFMVTIFQNVNLPAVIHLVFRIVDKIDFSKYGIYNNQHPLISLIKQDPDVWPLLHTNLMKLHENLDRESFAKKFNMFIVYTLCSEQLKDKELFRCELLKLHADPSTDLFHKIMVFNVSNLNRTVRYCKLLIGDNPSLAGTLILCVHEIIKNNSDATEAISTLKRSLPDLLERDLSVELMLMADVISVAPLMYMEDLLGICKDMLNGYVYPELIWNILKSSLIVWKFHFSAHSELTSAVLSRLNNLLNFNNVQSEPKRAIALQETFILDTRLYVIREILTDCVNVDNISVLDEAPDDLLPHFFKFFLGHLVGSTNEEVISRVFERLLCCAERFPSYTRQLLPVTLYKLSNFLQPKTQVRLWRSLPRMATLKENLYMIVTSLEALSTSSGEMRMFALSVFYELALVEKLCFPYVQNLLAASYKDNRQIGILKAFILKELCRKRFQLEVYQGDFSGYISKILNGDKGPDNAIAQALAIDGLRYLCANGVIDLVSAWEDLEPEFRNETRTPVIKSLCELLSEVSGEVTPGLKYEKLVEDAVKKLWQYTSSDRLEILESAFKALSHFTLEQVSLGIPEDINVEVINAYGNISGKCWISVLLRCKGKSELSHAGDMLQTFIAAEIKAYRKGVYEVSGSGEPQDISYLPSHSVLAAIVKYVKRNVTKWKKESPSVYIECLRILSRKYSKPIPPFDWCFLQEIILEPETREYCVRLASHQVTLSGTARRLLENYILALSEKNHVSEEAICVFECLKYLCNSIQPMILKPFVERTLQMTVRNFAEDVSDARRSLSVIVGSLRDVFENPELSDSNKSVIAQAVTSEIENLDFNQEVFDELLQCVHVIPPRFYNDLCDLKQYDELSARTVERSVKIQCCASLNSIKTPFVCLESLIACTELRICGGAEKNLSFQVLYKRLKPVFLKHRHNNDCTSWLISLLSRIQLELVDRLDAAIVMPKCVVFIIGVCVLTGFHVFEQGADELQQFCDCFPYALCTLCKNDTWSPHTPLILEWLYDISTNKTFKRDKEFEIVLRCFRRSLLTMRAEDAFWDKFKWMKYLEVVL